MIYDYENEERLICPYCDSEQDLNLVELHDYEKIRTLMCQVCKDMFGCTIKVRFTTWRI